jgi:hypothetical protein
VSFVVPAKAGPITPGGRDLARPCNKITTAIPEHRRHGVWVPAFAGTTLVVWRYSITAAWSGPCACLRSAALVEPIIIASGIAQSVTIITNW